MVEFNYIYQNWPSSSDWCVIATCVSISVLRFTYVLDKLWPDLELLSPMIYQYGLGVGVYGICESRTTLNPINKSIFGLSVDKPNSCIDMHTNNSLWSTENTRKLSQKSRKNYSLLMIYPFSKRQTHVESLLPRHAADPITGIFLWACVWFAPYISIQNMDQPPVLGMTFKRRSVGPCTTSATWCRIN